MQCTIFFSDANSKEPDTTPLDAQLGGPKGRRAQVVAVEAESEAKYSMLSTAWSSEKLVRPSSMRTASPSTMAWPGILNARAIPENRFV